MKIRSIVTVSAMTLVALASSAQALTFNTFVSGSSLSSVMNNNATVGFAYAGDKFVGSVYFGANNNQLYSTDLNGGNVAKFGGLLGNFAGEVYVAASYASGGYGSRDVFAGAENGGVIYRVSHDGSSTTQFASGLIGGVRSIAFDPTGLYGNKMVVATNAGRIYTVDTAGVATLLATIGEDAEGISFAPDAFGSYAAGTLFVASEGSGTLRAITPGGVKSTVVTGLGGAEMVSFVPLNIGASGNPVEGFYAARYPTDVQKASASQFVQYAGDAIITGESGSQVWQVHDTGAGFQVTDIGSFPGQPEDGIFVTAETVRLSNVPEHGNPAMLGFALIGLLALRRKFSRA